MKARDLINQGIIYIHDVIFLTADPKCWKGTQQKVNEATGFKQACFNLDKNKLLEYSEEDILNAEIIEEEDYI